MGVEERHGGHTSIQVRLVVMLGMTRGVNKGAALI